MSKFTNVVVVFLLLSLAVLTPGCAVAGGIFKAGIWVGVLVVVVVVGLILWMVSRGSGKS